MTNRPDSRETLLITTIDLIWQSNYDNVGVNEICKQAGVTKGCFYHHFESKADLFYQASLYYWDSIKHDLDSVYSSRFQAHEQLERLATYIINKQENRKNTRTPVSGCPFFTSGSQQSQEEEKVRLAATEMSEKAIRYNIALVKTLQAEGCLEHKANPEQVGRMIFEFVQGLLIYGRMVADLDIVRQDLREGLYRLTTLKPEFRTNTASTPLETTA